MAKPARTKPHDLPGPAREPKRAAPPIVQVPALPGWIKPTPGGVILDLAVVPNARRSGPAGLHDGALRVRIAAPAVEGAANAALLRWLADDIGLRLADLTIVSGEQSRRKRVAVCLDVERLRQWLDSVDARAEG